MNCRGLAHEQHLPGGTDSYQCKDGPWDMHSAPQGRLANSNVINPSACNIRKIFFFGVLSLLRPLQAVC